MLWETVSNQICTLQYSESSLDIHFIVLTVSHIAEVLKVSQLSYQAVLSICLMSIARQSILLHLHLYLLVEVL